MVRTLLTIAVLAMFSFESTARDCREDFNGIKEVLKTGADNHDTLLSGINDPKLSGAARAAAKLVKQNNTGADLLHAIMVRGEKSADATVAGEIVFGLDVLRSVDAEAFASAVVGLLSDKQVRSSNYLFSIVDRASFIVVSEKFATPRLRLPFLRALAQYRGVRDAFLRLNNAGQWLSAVLATPGLAQALTNEDLDLLCQFASEMSLRRVNELQSGAIAVNLAESEWQLARKFAVLVRGLTMYRACRTKLDGAMSTLDHVGRVRRFTPTP